MTNEKLEDKMFLLRPQDNGSPEEIKANKKYSVLYIPEGTKKTNGIPASLEYMGGYGLVIEVKKDSRCENVVYNRPNNAGYKVVKVYDIPREIVDLIFAKADCEALRPKARDIVEELVK